MHFPVTTLAAKRLQLLHQLAPSGTVFGLLANPTNPAAKSQTQDAQAAALALGLKLVVLNASSEHEIDASFITFVKKGVQAVLVSADAFFLNRRDQLVGLTARLAVPAMYHLREGTAPKHV